MASDACKHLVHLVASLLHRANPPFTALSKINMDVPMYFGTPEFLEEAQAALQPHNITIQESLEPHNGPLKRKLYIEGTLLAFHEFLGVWG